LFLRCIELELERITCKEREGRLASADVWSEGFSTDFADDVKGAFEGWVDMGGRAIDVTSNGINVSSVGIPHH